LLPRGGCPITSLQEWRRAASQKSRDARDVNRREVVAIYTNVEAETVGRIIEPAVYVAVQMP
jgi:hypothetical protein